MQDARTTPCFAVRSCENYARKRTPNMDSKISQINLKQPSVIYSQATQYVTTKRINFSLIAEQLTARTRSTSICHQNKTPSKTHDRPNNPYGKYETGKSVHIHLAKKCHRLFNLHVPKLYDGGVREFLRRNSRSNTQQWSLAYHC